jgi:hypothetical protein
VENPFKLLSLTAFKKLSAADQQKYLDALLAHVEATTSTVARSRNMTEAELVQIHATIKEAMGRLPKVPRAWVCQVAYWPSKSYEEPLRRLGVQKALCAR